MKAVAHRGRWPCPRRRPAASAGTRCRRCPRLRSRSASSAVAQRGTDAGRPLRRRRARPRAASASTCTRWRSWPCPGTGDFLKTALVEAHRAAPGETVAVTRAAARRRGRKLRVAARGQGRRRPLRAHRRDHASSPSRRPPAPTALTARLAPEGVLLRGRGPSPARRRRRPLRPPVAAATPSPPAPARPPAAPLSVGPAPFPSPSPTAEIPRPAAPVAAVPPPAATPRPANPGFRIYRRDPIASFDAPMQRDAGDRPRVRGPHRVRGPALVLRRPRSPSSTEPLVESAPSNEVCVDVRTWRRPRAPLGRRHPRRRRRRRRLVEPVSGGRPRRLPRVPRARGRRPGAARRACPRARPPGATPPPAAAGSHLYTVTAVDQAGNESAPSRPAEGHLP